MWRIVFAHRRPPIRGLLCDSPLALSHQALRSAFTTLSEVIVGEMEDLRAEVRISIQPLFEFHVCILSHVLARRVKRTALHPMRAFFSITTPIFRTLICKYTFRLCLSLYHPRINAGPRLETRGRRAADACGRRRRCGSRAGYDNRRGSDARIRLAPAAVNTFCSIAILFSTPMRRTPDSGQVESIGFITMF